jgi:TPR repeat protein
MSLDEFTIRRLFRQARAEARRAREERAAVAIAAPVPKKNHGPAVLAGVVACIALLAVCYGIFLHYRRPPPPPPPSTGQLYLTAPADPTAFAALSARAKAGDATAQFDLATLLDSNLLTHEVTVPKNDAAAFHWYQAAANAGFPLAENNLGFAYQNGHGVAANDAAAAKWYALAAAAGLANAENSLGYLYQNGLGVKHDDRQAVAWYQKAALQGSAAAENNFGAAYENGLGVKQNIPLAITWFERAAAQGEPNAENSLGFLYYNGIGVPQNATQSFKWFSLAAAAGNAPAQVNLGLLYARGIGVTQDSVSAAKWFLLARERGDTQTAPAFGSISPPLTAAQLAQAKAAAKAWDAQQKVQN